MGGGGVIPVAMHNGDLYFLFGQENDVIKDSSKDQDWVHHVPHEFHSIPFHLPHVI